MTLHDHIDAVLGGITAFLSVLVLDPGGLVTALLFTIWQQSGTLFTVTSILGFTLAPEVDLLPTGALRTLALAFGAVFVLSLLWKFGDNLEDRL